MKVKVLSGSKTQVCMYSSGLGHDNAWVGLNDRTVEEDFQWTDSNDLVSAAKSLLQKQKSFSAPLSGYNPEPVYAHLKKQNAAYLCREGWSFLLCQHCQVTSKCCRSLSCRYMRTGGRTSRITSSRAGRTAW